MHSDISTIQHGCDYYSTVLIATTEPFFVLLHIFNLQIDTTDGLTSASFVSIDARNLIKTSRKSIAPPYCHSHLCCSIEISI